MCKHDLFSSLIPVHFSKGSLFFAIWIALFAGILFGRATASAQPSMFDVYIDGCAYDGTWAIAGAAAYSNTESQTVALPVGNYEFRLEDGTGRWFRFSVDGAGNVTTSSPNRGIGVNHRLIVNIHQITIDVGVYSGEWSLPYSIGGPFVGNHSLFLFAETHEFDLEDGTRRWFYFAVDGAGSVTTVAPKRGIGGDHLLTLNIHQINIDVGVYSGEWSLPYSIGGPFVGNQSLFLFAETHEFDLEDGTRRWFYFMVDGSGNVTTIAPTRGIGRDHLLTLNIHQVTIDPGSYTSEWSLSGPVGGTFSGSHSLFLYAEQHAFTLEDGTRRWFYFTIYSNSGGCPVVVDPLTYTFGGSITIQFSTQCDLLPDLVITTVAPLPNGTVGTPYEFMFEAEGGVSPYIWSIVSGSLPPGLSLNPDTGQVTGTPTAVGQFGFTIQVADSSAVIATKQFSVAPPAPSGDAGAEYRIQISVPDTPPDSNTPACTNYALVTGTLPDGLILNPTTGVISGVPTDGGIYQFTVQCMISPEQTAVKEFIITINNPGPILATITPNSARASSGGFVLTLTGEKFVRSSVVYWNGAPRNTTYHSASELQAQILATDIEAQGLANVSVVNPEPSGGTSNTLLFIIEPPNAPPHVEVGGPYQVTEGETILLTADGSDPDDDPITYAWDLDNDGTFETADTMPTFKGIEGPSSHPVIVRVCDHAAACDTDETIVYVTNVPPTVDAGTDIMVYRNETVSVNGTWIDPATSFDAPYTWSWDLNGDGVSDQSGSANDGDAVMRTTSFATEGVYTLTFTVTDKDGGVGSDSRLVQVLNRSPDCALATPSVSMLWPPNNKFVPVNLLGLTDAEGDSLALLVTSIYQDEPVDSYGDGKFVPDGMSIGTETASIRAERTGTAKVPGDGRMYHIGFSATDGHGGVCTGTVKVGVPHDQNQPIIDGGPLYDSTVPVTASSEDKLSPIYLPMLSQ